MNLICADLNHNLLSEIVSLFEGTGFVLHYWQILVCTLAYALNFINPCFGSLYWLPRVPIGSLFHEKLGPYLSMEIPLSLGNSGSPRKLDISQSQLYEHLHFSRKRCYFLNTRFFRTFLGFEERKNNPKVLKWVLILL